MTDNTPAYPVLWSSDHRWEANFSELEVLWDDANGAVSALHGTPFHPYVDELAILFSGREMVMEFIDEAVQRGWVFFNRSSDIVRAEPFGTVYGVEYYFLRHPGKPWRLELMRKTSGISPLHDALKASAHENGFPVVHASFKPFNGESVDNYRATRDTMFAQGYRLAQECRSTYGAFGYWRKPGSISPAFYLKPRINTRDGGVR